MPTRFISIFLIFLFFHEVSSEDDCDYSPWSPRCTVECVKFHLVTLKKCRNLKYLQANPDFTNMRENLNVIFKDSDVKKVSNYAFVDGKFKDLVFRGDISEIEESAFAGVSIIGDLEISDTREFEILHPGMFRDLQCQKIIIKNTGIEYIVDDVFSGLSNLAELQISSNFKLSYVSSGAFKGLRKLTVLYLEDSAIPCLPVQLFNPLFSLDNLLIKQDMPYMGICAKTFAGINPFVSLEQKVSSCVAECSPLVQGLNTLPPDEEPCMCNLTEGCYNTCPYIERREEPEPNYLIYYIIAACIAALLIILIILVVFRNKKKKKADSEEKGQDEEKPPPQEPESAE